MYVCVSYIHVCVCELHTCMCVQATYMYVCMSYMHVCVYELHTCNVHVLCDTHIYVAGVVSSYISCASFNFPSHFFLSVSLTSLPHPYLSPSFTLFSKAILDGRHEMAMLLWSSPNHPLLPLLELPMVTI